MNLSSFLIRIIFLSLPGVVASTIYRKLRGKTVLKDWEDVIEMGLFALLSYLFYALAIGAIHGDLSGAPSVLNAFYDEKISITWREILPASGVGVILAFAASFLYTHKIVNRLGRSLRVTRRFGDEDVWTYFNNVPDLYWVIVRDHKLDLAYYGWIQVYSDSDKERELLLRDVKVYNNSTSEFRYEASAMYLCRDRYSLTLEVPETRVE
jgi:hypothetical protein